jgi:1,4-alpha-glucan branching enzyme
MNALMSPDDAATTRENYPARRPMHAVNFFCHAPDAKRVSVIGDFNDWDLTATPMHHAPDGRWLASLELPHGHHRYLFLVDGHPVLDPNSYGTVRNEKNEKFSLLAVS